MKLHVSTGSITLILAEHILHMHYMMLIIVHDIAYSTVPITELSINQ